MTTYRITYVRNDACLTILVDATTAEAAAAYFAAYKPYAVIIATEAATSDDQRPGKPHLTANV